MVLATFYDQDRSDATGGQTSPHGWGALEAIDPDTTDGIGTAYAVRTLDPTTIVTHPLTTGVTALAALRGNPGPYAGGNQAKPGTIVVATWAQPNARGLPDPAIAYRITGTACVIQVGIAVDYPVLATFNMLGTDFSGNYYQVWANAFAFGATGCWSRTAPALSPGSPPVGPTAPISIIGAAAFRSQSRWTELRSSPALGPRWFCTPIPTARSRPDGGVRTLRAANR